MLHIFPAFSHTIHYAERKGERENRKKEKESEIEEKERKCEEETTKTERKKKKNITHKTHTKFLLPPLSLFLLPPDVRREEGKTHSICYFPFPPFFGGKEEKHTVYVICPS